MSVRLHFIVEGQTEETFVNQTLRPHLADRSISACVLCVSTGHNQGFTYRGGLSSYIQAKNDIMAWITEDQGLDARFTTMFDLYRLPADFPGYGDAMQMQDPYDRVRVLENAMEKDIADTRFIPYIQLHEYEALLLSDPQKLDLQFHDCATGIQRLIEMTCGFDSPELINDGPNTAPSKRIIGEIGEYSGRKASAGPIVAGYIGLPALRSKCSHFGGWLDKLESLV